MPANYFAEALHEKAQALYLHHNYPEMIQLLTDALPQMTDCEPPLKGQILLLLAQSYFSTTRYREARKICREACSLFQSRQLFTQAALCHQLSGQIHLEQGEYREAINAFTAGLALFPRHLTPDERILKGEIHIALGRAAAEILDTDLQHTHFLRSLFLARGVENQTLAAQALLGLGCSFFQRDKYTFAHQVLLKAIQSFQAAGDLRGVALALHTLGQVYTCTFEYRRAVNAFKYAYTLFQHQADPLHQASSLVHLGRIFVKIDPETAEKVCREVTDLLISQTSVHSRRQSEIILGRYSVVMGLYYQQTNQLDLARSLLKEGVEIFLTHQRQAEYAEAREFYQEIQAMELPAKPRKNNILAFKLGITS